MKKVIIVHRWDGSPDTDWYPWLKRELENKGYHVIVPEMPSPSEPTIPFWVGELIETLDEPDRETSFIGHSIGCQTIMRYIETLPENVRVGKVVFVAGWFDLENLENEESERIAKPWIERPINMHSVKNKVREMKVFLSSDEPYGFIEENASTFKNELGAKVVIEKGKGHFTENDGVTKVPEVLAEF